MGEKSFLPDGSPVRSRLLARAPYAQGAMAEIAAGADPASFEPSPASGGTWGVLYVSDAGAGFFSVRSEPTMLGFSLNSGEVPPAPIHLAFSPGRSATLAFDRAKRLPGRLGAFLSRIVASDDAAVVRWEESGTPREMRFLISNGDPDEFERAFRALPPAGD